MTPLPIHYSELQRIYAGTIGRGMQTLAITSAEPGEGVSTIAYALARRAAASGERTLLVELNLFRPAIVQELGLEAKGPWTPDVESAQAAMTEFPSMRLSVLPAPVGISSLDLLRFADRRLLADLLTAWREKFDVIVCDCSAINRTNKGNIATTAICEAGAAPVLVVLSGQTTARQVEQAIASLSEAGVTPIGTVLNKRFDPPLYQELSREVTKLERWAPRLSAWCHRRIEQNRKLLS